MVSRSEPGLAVSALGHATVLVAGLLAFAGATPLPEHQEAIAVEVIDPSALNQVTRGERQAEKVQEKPESNQKVEMARLSSRRSIAPISQKCWGHSTQRFPIAKL